MTPPLFSELQAVAWTPEVNVSGPVQGIIIDRRWCPAHFDTKANEWLEDYWLYRIQSGDERTQYDVWVFEKDVAPSRL